ncbi:CBS domain-containing protein [Methanococcus voltae]|uniref:CBS domain-containing protein n=2 Tax=Methanococcus voltae TaxID=2188 RepID=A0A8J7RIB0_METVO|nr:CBS domain-containing protein [Methanococcus voltae]MBP2172959.1 CBS domain-containing protein [Methanococcus voltae]MBP2201985.1 CBS domain-containing protein [Methanococcus voltae]MCS3922148.1 CBS domain-containing protein [Methanococcus voltae PS]
MNLEVSVTEAMSAPVKTVGLDTTLYEVANTLKEHGIGCLIALNDLQKPVGIITEKDLVLNVVARNLKSKEITVREIISSKKLISISPKSTVMDAAKKMDELTVKRLPVIDGDKLFGIITVSDITKVSPELFNLLLEASIIHNNENEYDFVKKEEMTGICEVCGAHDSVNFVNGKYVCRNCLESGFQSKEEEMNEYEKYSENYEDYEDYEEYQNEDLKE